MESYRLRLYEPHAGQRVLHDSAAQFRICNTGRQWGKTWACVNEIAKFAWEHPRTRSSWVAPTYKQAIELAWNELIAQFHATDRHGKFVGAFKDISISERVLTWENDSQTYIRSADNPDTMRGSKNHFLVVDEAAMMKRDVWELVLNPTIATTNGRVIFISTPKGRNWFYQLWMRGQDPTQPDYASFVFPSSQNPYCAPSVIENARLSNTEDAFKQEWLAEFLEDGAGVFRNIERNFAGQLEGPRRGHSYCLGWDVGKHQDPSVVSVLDIRTGQVVAFDRFLGVDYTIQAERVKWYAERYSARIVMDATHGSVGDPMFDHLSQMGLTVDPFTFTNKTKQALVEHLVLRLEQRDVKFPDPATCPEDSIKSLANELRIFERELLPGGTVRYNAPDGFHDDCVIALALSAWGAFHGGGLVEMYRRQYEGVPSVEA